MRITKCGGQETMRYLAALVLYSIFAVVTPVYADAPTLTPEQEALVVSAVHAQFGDQIPNPAVSAIVPIRQEDGYVTSTVHFESHAAEGRYNRARRAFCLQGSSLDEWECVEIWDVTYFSVAGQNPLVRMGDPAPDAVVDALIAHVRDLPGNSRWPVTRDDVSVISAVDVAPSGHIAQIVTSTGARSSAIIELTLCDPDTLKQALAAIEFHHAGARDVCGVPDEQLPRSANGWNLVTQNGIAIPADQAYLLVHYDHGFAALRQLDIVQLERKGPEGRPIYHGKVEVLYSEDGDFERSVATVVEVTDDYEHQDQFLIKLPGLRLQWVPPTSFVQIANRNGILAAARTFWQDRRMLDGHAASLDWYYVHADSENRLWSAQHLPRVRVTNFTRTGTEHTR